MEPYGPTLYFKYLTVGVGKEKSVEEKETREGGGALNLPDYLRVCAAKILD